MPIDRTRLGRLAASCRRTGYLVERLSEVSVASYTLLAGLTAASPPAVAKALNGIVAAFPYRYYLESDLREPRPLPVSLICAPTYTPQGLPDLLLATLLMRDTSAVDIERHGSALREAADSVTAAVGGHNPWTSSPERNKPGPRPTPHPGRSGH